MNRIVLSAGLVFMFAVVAGSTPLDCFVLEKLSEASDSVLVCHVDRAVATWPKPNRVLRTRFECTVLAVFKGEVCTNVCFTCVTDFANYSKLDMCERVREGGCSILFLKSDKEHGYVFSDKQNPSIPLVRFSEASDKGGSIHDRICQQLTAALDSQDSGEVANALEWLKEVRGAPPRDKLDRLAESPDSKLRMLGMKALVEQGDVKAVREAGDILLSPDVGNLSENELLWFGWALAQQARLVNIRTAHSLASSTNAVLERVGLEILRSEGNETSIPYLIQALDGDKQMKRLAIHALARITGLTKLVTPDEFDNNPSAATQKWKDWWRQEGKAWMERTNNDPKVGSGITDERSNQRAIAPTNELRR